MRRITLKYAKPGMVIGMPVYDSFGNVLLLQNTELDERSLASLARSGATELLIDEWRVADVLVTHMVSPEMEGALALALRQLAVGPDGGISAGSLNHVLVAVSNIARSLAVDAVSEAGVLCCISEQDYGHLQPVKAAALAMALGHRLNMPVAELFLLGAAAALKDVGYGFFLAASGGQTVSEKDHPAAGFSLLQQHRSTAGDIATAVLQHHEFWNGNGYPQRLKGQQISRYAQIVSLADAYCDLLADRPGRGKYMPHEAVEFVMANSGDQFNPELVELFVRQVPSYPGGITVRLNSGEIGIVSSPNLGFIARPTVRICYEPARGALKQPYDMNLAAPRFQQKLVSKVLEYD